MILGIGDLTSYGYSGVRVSTVTFNANDEILSFDVYPDLFSLTDLGTRFSLRLEIDSTGTVTAQYALDVDNITGFDPTTGIGYTSFSITGTINGDARAQIDCAFNPEPSTTLLFLLGITELTIKFRRNS